MTNLELIKAGLAEGFEEISLIKEALLEVVAEEATQTKPKLEPYDKPMDKAPSGFEWKDYKVMPLESAEIVHSQLKAMNDRALKLKDIETKATEMRTEVADKIKELEVKEGKTKLTQEMNDYKNKLGEAVESLTAEVGPVLLESNSTVLGIYEQLVSGAKPTPAKREQILLEKIKAFASPEVAGIIVKQFDDAVKAIEIAGDSIRRRLVNIPVPQDMPKKVKEYVPKASSIKQADVLDTVKSFGLGLLNALKSAWESVSDKISTLLGSMAEVKPKLDEIKALAGEAGLEV
jgi:hypothetical protein